MKPVKFGIIDLTQPLSVLTPPWPTYEPLQLKFFKRLAPNGANGQLVTTSNHVGTHLDGPLHFCTHGGDIASLPLNDYLCGPGVVVDLSDIAEDYGIYSSADVEARVEVEAGRHPHHQHRLPSLRLGPAGGRRGPLYGQAPRADDGIRQVVQAEEDQVDRRGRRLGRPSDEHQDQGVDARRGQAGRGLPQAKYGKGLDDFFPPEDYQLMHVALFHIPIVHAENLGGDIDLVLNQRVTIGCFPWRFVGGESSICEDRGLRQPRRSPAPSGQEEEGAPHPLRRLRPGLNEGVWGGRQGIDAPAGW